MIDASRTFDALAVSGIADAVSKEAWGKAYQNIDCKVYEAMLFEFMVEEEIHSHT